VREEKKEKRDENHKGISAKSVFCLFLPGFDHQTQSQAYRAETHKITFGLKLLTIIPRKGYNVTMYE
jgi:hypothetical protein